MPTANELYQASKVAGNVAFQAEWGRTQQQLAKLSAGERVSQLGLSSLDPGEYVMAYDALGQARMRIGHQSDGTVGVVYGNGKPPLVPTDPLVGARQLGVFIGWDGLFAGGYAMPGDFARVDVHMSDQQGFQYDGSTIVGTIPDTGGILVGADNTTHYVKMVAVTHSKTADGGAYVASAPTAEIAVLPLPASQIAAGAIGAQQLAADIALLSRLIVGDPTAARLEIDGRVGAAVPGMHLYNASGQETLSMNTVTGDVSLRGQIRTADSGERLVIHEEDTANDIRFYPTSGSNYGLLYSGSYAEAVTNATRFGVTLTGPLSSDATPRRTRLWATDNSAQMYRGVPDGSQDYGGFFAFDTYTTMTFKAAASASGIPTSQAYVDAGQAALKFGSTNSVYTNAGQSGMNFGTAAGISVDGTGVYLDHVTGFAAFTLSSSNRWVFQDNIFWNTNLNCGLLFATTGVDIYNPSTGAALYIGTAGVVPKSARHTKTAIDELPFDPVEVIRNAPVSMWEYKDEQRDEHGNKRKARKRFGPMADDLPALLQHPTVSDPSIMGIELIAQTAVAWAAIDRLAARLDALENA